MTPPPNLSSRPPAAWIWACVALIVGAIALVYSNALGGGAVLDDFSSVIDNPSIRALRAEGLFAPAQSGVAGRPLANLSYALNYAAGGLDLRGYRATNIALHMLAALALFGVVRRTLAQPGIATRVARAALPLAAGVALWWGVHPVQTGTVDYLSQRTEELGALFYLLTLYAFVRGVQGEGGGRGWLIASVLACACGMASKETMVTAPVAIFWYDCTFVAGGVRTAWRARRKYYGALAATWLLLAALMLGSSVADRGVGFGLGVPWFDYALNESRAVLHYARLVLWPDPLVFDHGWAYEPHRLALAPALLACGALLAVVIFSIRRWPRAAFGFGWFFLLLAPTSSVVPVLHQPIAESRMYLPLAGPLAGVAAGLVLAGGRRTLVAGGAIAIACGGLTLKRNEAYRSEIALYTDTLAKQPDNIRAHGALAEAYLIAGRVEEALAEARRALAFSPTYPEANNTAAAALVKLGRPEPAIALCRAALQVNPLLAPAHYNLGCALAATGQPAEAWPELMRAHELQPDHAETENNLGVVALQLGRVEDAIMHDQAAMRLAPGLPDAPYNLGNALAQAGQLEAASAAFEAALRLKPDFAKAENNLAITLFRRGKVDEAVGHFQAALRIQPDYAEAQRNLARLRPEGAGQKE